MNRILYRMNDAIENVPGRWHLDSPVDNNGMEIEPRIFAEGIPVHFANSMQSGRYIESYSAQYANEPFKWTGQLFIPIAQHGAALDITFGPFDMLVMRSKVADLIEAISPHCIQRFPAIVNGNSSSFDIVNVVSLVDCVDEVRTKAYRQSAYDDPSVDIPGKYARIGKRGLHLLTSQLAKTDPRINIFRLTNYETCLIVSDEVKNLVEANHLSGVEFQKIVYM